MEKIRRFISIDVPVTACTLKCSYCYVRQHKRDTGKLPNLPSPEKIRQALSKQRLGGMCYLNMTGAGETLLPKEMLPVIKCLLEEGHIVSVTSNMTLDARIDEIIRWPSELLQNLVFACSLHYKELNRIGKLDTFFENIHKVRKAGCSYWVTLCLANEYIPVIDEIKNKCLQEVGFLPEVYIIRDEMRKNYEVKSEELLQIESVAESFNSQAYKFQKDFINVKRKEFCYSGDWSLMLNLENGNVSKCLFSLPFQNIYDNPNEPIHFKATGYHCRAPYCLCGLEYLGRGVIPELACPNVTVLYGANEKNFSPHLLEICTHKLSEVNHEYSKLKKWYNYFFGRPWAYDLRPYMPQFLRNIAKRYFYHLIER